MKRREFITLLGGAAAWPVAAGAQQPADKRPLIAVLIAGSEAAYHRDLESFRGGMRQLGYSDGENIRYEYRFADGDLERQQTWFAATRMSSCRHRWPHIWRPNRPPPPSRL